MAAPAFVNSAQPTAIDGYLGGGSTATMPLPGSRGAGNLLVALITMTGTPSMPSGWTLKHLSATAAVAYARVDGTTITTGSGALNAAFGDGGSAVYYTGCIVQVSGALASGDPFDGVTAGTTTATTTAALSLTTTVAETLLLLGAGNLTNIAVTAAPTGMTMNSSAVSYQHVAYGVLAAAGASGTKQATYGSAINNWSELVAIKPVAVAAKQGSATGAWSAAGTATGTRTPKGAATGGWSASGTATGQKTPQGSATGSWSVSGTATGTRTSQGVASGGWATSGTAAGESADPPATGSATGGWSAPGTASGVTAYLGSATGSWTVGGTASGSTVRSGAAPGAHSWIGTATGAAVEVAQIPRRPEATLVDPEQTATITRTTAEATIRNPETKAVLT